MQVRLKKISPLPAAKVAAAIYGCLSLVFVPFLLIGALASAVSGAEGSGIVAAMGIGMFIIIPIAYVITGFLGTLLACWLYNLAAGWLGGIELELAEFEAETNLQ